MCRRYTSPDNPRQRSDSSGRGYQPPNKVSVPKVRVQRQHSFHHPTCFSTVHHATQPDTQPNAIRVPSARTGLGYLRIPPTVATAPQSAVNYIRAPPGLSNPTPIQSNLHHNYTPYKHNTCNTTTHNKNTANANHTPPQSRTKRNHTADTPQPTTHATRPSQRQRGDTAPNQSGSVPEVHVFV